MAGPAGSSFFVRRFKQKNFPSPYHYHPEYELTLIVEGSGKRYVGTSMQDYSAGDLVLLGSNLPHCWKTGDSPTGNSVSVVVHFKDDFMGGEFLHKPEMSRILQLLQSSHSGLQFTGDITAITNKMEGLVGETDNYRKLIVLLNILHELSAAPACNLLQKPGAYATLSVAERERINRVMTYLLDNFRQQVTLSDAAAKANMATHAFCKYFKRLTRKTFLEAVNDNRIDFAVRQLVYTDKTISQICFESGFNDVSNFHKTFKARMAISPLSYRNKFIRLSTAE